MEVSLLRSGTSKGVYVRLTDLPPEGPERDELALGLLGSPDPMQLDGLGGTHSSTSKLMAVGSADEARALGYDVPDNADIVSLFAQIVINEASVEWRGNCGNLTAGVPVFALHEGMMRGTDPVTKVTLFNLNTQTPITFDVPTRDGQPRSDGDFVLPGVPGTGSRIDMTFHPRTNAPPIFPTQKRIETISTDLGDVDVTIIHVNNPFVIVRAASLGLRGSELPSALNADAEMIERLALLRGEAAVRLGLAPNPYDARTTSPAIPRVVLVSEPHDHTLVSGDTVHADEADVVVRSTSLGPIHHALPATALVVVPVATRLEGTVLDGIAAPTGPQVRLAHPKGIVDVAVGVEDDPVSPRLQSVTVARTARRIMKGIAYPSPAAAGLLTNGAAAAREPALASR